MQNFRGSGRTLEDTVLRFPPQAYRQYSYVIFGKVTMVTCPLIQFAALGHSFQSMRTVGKMCLDLAIGVLRALFEKAPVRQGRFGAKFAKRQLFFDTQIFLFRIQKVIFGIHTAVRQGFNVGFCQSKCSVVFSFGVFSSTFQVGPIDHCQRPVKHTNCLPVTFTRAKLVRP